MRTTVNQLLTELDGVGDDNEGVFVLAATNQPWDVDPALRRGALGHNAHGRFECRWVQIEPQPSSRCLWTRDLVEPIHCPIAHGEGRYVHPDPESLAAAGQVVLRYRSTNPNGSVADIAGVCNPAGNVLGLMPHPENFIVPRQHPLHSSGADFTEHLGLHLFRNGVNAAKGF